MREPKVRNKYNIKPRDISKLVILRPECLRKPPFWRNDVINAYCLSDTTIKSKKDNEFGCYDEYWIGFYDKNAKSHAGEIRLSCCTYGGMCSYNFTKFFDEEEITCELNLEIQEKLLRRVNWLLDEGICGIPEKECN